MGTFHLLLTWIKHSEFQLSDIDIWRCNCIVIRPMYLTTATKDYPSRNVPRFDDRWITTFIRGDGYRCHPILSWRTISVCGEDDVWGCHVLLEIFHHFAFRWPVILWWLHLGVPTICVSGNGTHKRWHPSVLILDMGGLHGYLTHNPWDEASSDFSNNEYLSATWWPQDFGGRWGWNCQDVSYWLLHDYTVEKW